VTADTSSRAKTSITVGNNRKPYNAEILYITIRTNKEVFDGINEEEILYQFL
jgi:hypothetical protein